MYQVSQTIHRFDDLPPPPPMSDKAFIISMGSGNMMVEFFSAEIWVRVCRYLSCRAAGDSEITIL